jgi:hypothetical protein
MRAVLVHAIPSSGSFTAAAFQFCLNSPINYSQDEGKCLRDFVTA